MGLVSALPFMLVINPSLPECVSYTEMESKLKQSTEKIARMRVVTLLGLACLWNWSTASADYVSLSPTGSQTVAQPAGTTLSISSLNGVLNASLFSGADIGQKINNAIAALAGCGTIQLSTGSYSLSTQIIKPRCVMIDGQNAVLTATASTKPMIIAGDSGSINAITVAGGIKNLQLIGAGASSSSLGIWLGGDTANVAAPSTYIDSLEKFENVTISGFATAYAIGYKAFQDSWIGGVIESNTWGVSDQGQYYAENMNFHGVQILNNTGNGVVAQAGSEFNFFGSSLDYNQGGAVYSSGSVLTFSGCHFEQSSGLFVIVAQGSSESSITINGGSMFLTGTSSSQTSYLQVGGTNSSLSVTNLTLTALHGVTEFVDWASAGTSNSVNISNMFDPENPSLAVLNSNANVQMVNASGPTVGSTVGSMTSQPSGSIGLGTTSPLSFTRLDVRGPESIIANLGSSSLTSLENTGGVVIGGNISSGGGEADFIENQGAGSTGGFNFYNYSNAGALTRMATLYPNGSMWIGGVLTQASDQRVKKNVEPITDATDKLLALRGVTYQFRDDLPGEKFPEERQLGLIAQEVEKVVPEVVLTDKDGYKSIAYQNLVALLIESAKDMHARGTSQEQQIVALEGKNSEQAHSISELKGELERQQAELAQERAEMLSQLDSLKKMGARVQLSARSRAGE